MNKDGIILVDPPGLYIKEELEARGWSQRDLAYVLGMAEQQLSRVLSGNQAVTPDMARLLGDAFDVPAEFFANLQKQYDLARAKAPDPAVKTRAALQLAFPIREMIRRGWIEDSDPALLELQVTRFFEAANLNEVPKLPFAAKRTHYDDDPPGQIAWLFRVRQLARQISVPSYSETKLRDALRKLRALTIDPESVEQVFSILAECGVRFVIVESLPNAKLDGVCTWLDDQSPVIGMSTFYDRLDNFWFVLRHEIEHVLLRHGEERAILDNLEGEAGSDSKNIAQEERLANAAAASFCIPNQKMESFYLRKNPYFSERDVIGFASIMEVHPAIVVGQIQHMTRRFGFLRKYQVPIRKYVVLSGIADGWGNVASANL